MAISTTIAQTSSMSADASADNGTIVVAGSDRLIDPGTGRRTIQLAAGATNDALVLHAAATDRILGFDPAAGDTLDLTSLLAEASVDIGDVTQLATHISIANVDGSAAIVFDPAGQGSGSQVALLTNDGGMVAQLQTFKAFAV